MKKKPYRTTVWVIRNKKDSDRYRGLDPSMIALGMFFLTRSQAERERKCLYNPKNWESIKLEEVTT